MSKNITSYSFLFILPRMLKSSLTSLILQNRGKSSVYPEVDFCECWWQSYNLCCKCYNLSQYCIYYKPPHIYIVWLVIYPMSGNNTTLKIDFTDPRNRNFVCSFVLFLFFFFLIYWIENDTTVMKERSTYQIPS